MFREHCVNQPSHYEERVMMYYCGKCGIKKTNMKGELCFRCKGEGFMVRLLIVHGLPESKYFASDRMGS